ncbi:peptidase S45 penicillin amidase [Gemmatirosa kalamazoonensis]|uniref:Peptidase S45 penicillin amidase n=1 Tax=Gemmatirosa kalamazoonensis TaxID=861299 RepID=W0RBQ8_9BACT|nr:penicillin acylase family protein [Gemmatirosa kalamazoonensis]AHG88211.1 peptidase S45 penicillin amidase [Gemmatirosa kalamazoonensis]
MRRLLTLAILAPALASAQRVSKDATADVTRWQKQAQAVTITRDDHGIAHVRGRTDADAVFGMVYAQAEDDFNRVETNFINSQGRLAEAEGERAIWQDLRMKLFIDPDTLKAQYAASPAWLKSLMTAWADGLNYYLATHPQVKPRVITRFEPWMALSFSEGSIGGDIESVSLRDLEAFYGKRAGATSTPEGDAGPGAARKGRPEREQDIDDILPPEPTGSNGIAIGPKNSANGHAFLLINPHTTFFFRSELQMTSDEGLNAYGAATWGQFFLYQGFNDRLGWMHTSSAVDVIDEYAETIVDHGGRFAYKYGTGERPVVTQTVRVPYRAPDGTMAERAFTVYRTHHGPVVREADGKWITVSLMNTPVAALSQSYLRTKARSLAEYEKVFAYKANSSNNTIYADADGHIAYFHPQFVPKRDDRFDWTKPVDGSDPATDWRGVHDTESMPHLVDPATGWLYNSNNWPYTAAGPESPKQSAFPRYMDTAGENERGLHALQLLPNAKHVTLDSVLAIAYDSWQPFFARFVPQLVAAYDAAPATDPLKPKLADPIAALRAWDYRWGVQSVPTTVAVFWAEELFRRSQGRGLGSVVGDDALFARTSAADKLAALDAAVARLTTDFGSWRTPWGEFNRFQRLTGDLVAHYDDAQPSVPVGFTSALWGSLASFRARRGPDTKREYGYSGNSFVAAIEFGKDSVRARAVSAGGESGDPKSPHFTDQAVRYATGNLRPVYFYPNQLVGHTERTYHPGQ